MSRLTHATLPSNPAPHVVLHCTECFADYSACRGDYCTRPPSKRPICVACGGHLVLALKKVRVFYSEIRSPKDAEHAS